MQDLAELDSVAASDAGVEMQLYHPKTQSDLGIFITLLGRDSKDYRRVQSVQNRKRTERMTKGGVFKPAVVTSEEIEQNTIELLSACTKAWRSVTNKERRRVDRQRSASAVRRSPAPPRTRQCSTPSTRGSKSRSTRSSAIGRIL
jgi:hypothetical protein